MAVATPDRQRLRLDVEGMTCASCAARIERKLNRLDGVDATVNYATEEAAVSFDPAAVSVDDLIATVEAIGYRAAPPSDLAEVPDASRGVRTRLAVAAVLTTPLVLLAMVPPLRVDGWEWLALALATPVVFWCGGRIPPRDAPQRPARRRDDGHPDLRRHPRRLDVVHGRARRRDRRAHVLRGCGRDHHADPPRPLARAARARPLERGHPRPAPARREGGARPPRRRRGARPGRRARGRRPVRRPAGGEDLDRRHRRGRDLAIDQSMLTGEPVPVEAGPGAEVAGATINSSGRLVVRATRVGAETALAQIARLVTEAQTGKAPIQRLVDRVAAVFVPVVLGDRAGDACRLACSSPGTSRPRSPPPLPC